MVMEMRRWWERVREISWATDRDDLASKMSATKSLRALKRFPGETYDWSTIIDKHATIVSPQKKKITALIRPFVGCLLAASVCEVREELVLGLASMPACPAHST